MGRHATVGGGCGGQWSMALFGSHMQRRRGARPGLFGGHDTIRNHRLCSAFVHQQYSTYTLCTRPLAMATHSSASGCMAVSCERATTPSRSPMAASTQPAREGTSASQLRHSSSSLSPQVSYCACADSSAAVMACAADFWTFWPSLVPLDGCCDLAALQLEPLVAGTASRPQCCLANGNPGLANG